MKIWNLLVKIDPKDKFKISASKGEVVQIFDFSKAVDSDRSPVKTNIFSLLSENSISPKDAMRDLLMIALAVYTADQIVSRQGYGFQGWSRHFKLFMPVFAVKKWNRTKDELQEMLSFLSGDKWEIYFRETHRANISSENPHNNIAKVSLFSGGLDSFTAAVELLERKEKLCFISHYKGGVERSIQTYLYDRLAKHYGEDSFIKYQITVRPNRTYRFASKEPSSRARSFLFLCLGLTFANSYGEDLEFIIPENGLISLNVPLTGTRLGSHSSRTTHPYFISLFKKILSQVGIRNPINNPYQFVTKGEMMNRNRNNALYVKLYWKTMSCSHPDQSRFLGKEPGIHCGYCIPCLIRRASEYRSNLKKTVYSSNVISNPPSPASQSGRDLRAFKIGLERFRSTKPGLLGITLLSGGPVPEDDEHRLTDYVSVYKRGMAEVGKFLNQR